MRQLDSESVILMKDLEKKGIDSSLEDWDDPETKWGESSLAINRTTTNYVFDPRKYLEWARRVEEVTTLWNPSEVLKWNYHKRYILELQDAGVPVPETILIEQNADKPLNQMLEAVEWDEFVLKPCIGAGSMGLKRFTKDSPDLEHHFRNLNQKGYSQIFPFGEVSYDPCDILIQPFLTEITEVGEASLIFFGGEFSHSVIKKPRTGDFRAHPLWGAEVQRYNASEEEREVGYGALDVVGYPTEYARIDMIMTRSGPLIIEVELIDPFLFFDHFPDTVDTFTHHIENFLKQ